MFKIHDDKVYFVAETPDINKVIEIFLPKDDRGTIMDSHEIRVDLCRAVIHMEKKGVRVLKVRNIEDTNKASIDIWHMPEYQEAAESPVSDVVNACIESCFDSGAMFNLPCKANRKTHEVFAVECCASPDDDDSFSYAEVKINGKYYPINFIDDILLENNVDDFDTKEILGASPYWRSDVMKNEFKKVSSPQERHDYVVYKMHEDILNQRYHESVQTVLAELKKVIPRIELTGQWSVDVMRNGNDYYIIDMALAENSALNDCVPKNLLRAYPQQWLPGESNS